MKSGKLVAALILQAVLAMGVLSHVNAEYFPKCCNECRSFSGVLVCDDAHPRCPAGCSACRVVQVRPVKTFRCADMRSSIDGPCGPLCNKHS